MIETIGQLDLDEKGDYDFHGISSGAVFFRRMKEHFQISLGRDYQIPYLPPPPRPAGVLKLDSPGSAGSSPWDSGPPNIYDLPPKARARSLCSSSLRNATCVLRIVHIPSFYETLDGLYDRSPETFGYEDNRNLALMYAVMALGSMYNVAGGEDSSKTPYKAAIEEG